jgi:Do/DeqQ family serine protease
MPANELRKRLAPALGVHAAMLILAFAYVPRAAAGALPAAVDGQAIPSLAPMLERVVPAVVNINSKARVRVRNPFLDDPTLRQFFGMQNVPRERIAQSLGSGVIIDAGKGFVLTNNHVVEGADDISVTLHDGRSLSAKLVGTDPDTDVAVIQIPAQNLSAMPVADSNHLRVGDFVVAVGNPFGVGQSATSGIVSGLNRTGLGGRGFQNFIQTDATINPGNSGGALVNLRGELVGINSQIFSTSGGSNGIGFAIPSNLAADVMRQLIATGSVKRGTLGLQAQDMTAQIANMLGTKLTQGAVVTQVRDNSPADTAGIRAGDIVVALNGRPVNTENDLYNAEGLLPVNSNVELKLVREGRTLTLTVPLAAEQLSSTQGSKLDPRIAGAELSEVSERVRRQGLNGVSVTRVAAGSAAAQNGLKQGDLIVAVGQVQISGLADLTSLAQKHPRQLQLAVVRDRNLSFCQCSRGCSAP